MHGPQLESHLGEPAREFFGEEVSHGVLLLAHNNPRSIDKFVVDGAEVVDWVQTRSGQACELTVRHLDHLGPFGGLNCDHGRAVPYIPNE